ncbi:hypothetical protein BH09PSE1_BH09PSE1_08100 [soil metagenome]
MSENKIHAPAVSVAMQGLACGALGADAQAVTTATPLPGYSPGGLLTVAASFVRPADTTAYAVGDLAANSALAGSVVPVELIGAMRSAGEAIRIERVRLRKSGPSLINAAFRVHLFRKAPTVGVGDNGAFNASGVLALTDIEGHVGYIDVTMDLAAAVGARGVGVPGTGAGVTCEAAGAAGHETSLWALIETRAVYAPVSGETFYLTVEGARS